MPEVLSLRPGIEYFVRIAVCAAFLTTSFLGQWLHHLEHHVGGRECSKLAHSSHSTHPYSHACERSYKNLNQVDEENSSHDHGLPAAPHDYNSCCICYVMVQPVSNLVLTLELEVTEPLFEQSQADSELAAPAAGCC